MHWNFTFFVKTTISNSVGVVANAFLFHLKKHSDKMVARADRRALGIAIKRLTCMYMDLGELLLFSFCFKKI